MAERFLTGRDLGKTYDKLDATAQGIGSQGGANLDEGLNGLRGLAGDYRGYIANGGLTPDLNRQFGVAQGALEDQYTRSGRSLRAALEQRRAQSGGQLSPAAIAEMEKQGDESNTEGYFGASNALAMQKANLSFDATKDWYSRLQNISDTMRSTGLSQQQQAMLARLQIGQLRYQRNKAIADTVVATTAR